MSSPPALEADTRVAQRPRGRATICRHGAQEASGRRGGTPTGGRLTLGQLLDGVWEGLSAGGEAVCPVCPGRMRKGAGVARCERCGTMLS